MVERRLTILAAIVLLWGAAILKNLISLQVVHHREYAVRARSIQEVVEDIPAPRGTIFDRDGRPLAMSLASRTVFINPMKVDVGVASDLLGYLLHLDRSELYLKIKQAADALAKLRPVFQVNGTVTAGNSSQTSDGAAAVIVMSE